MAPKKKAKKKAQAKAKLLKMVGSYLDEVSSALEQQCKRDAERREQRDL